jgi:arsenite methyltransferase
MVVRGERVAQELNVTAIQDAVRKKYAEVSCSAEGKFQYPTGRAGVLALAYDPSVMREMPDEVLEAFCGVGNPFSLGSINRGETLLDVGCGAGIDLIAASRLIGATGQICGIDLTPEMVERAQTNLRRAGVHNGEVRVAEAEAIPYADCTFDVVISNGVLNLSPLKKESFSEIFRVLRPGGRLQCADIVLREHLPAEMAGSLEAWSD